MALICIKKIIQNYPFLTSEEFGKISFFVMHDLTNAFEVGCPYFI